MLNYERREIMAFSKKKDVDMERFELLRKKVRTKKKIIEELLKVTMESQTRWSDMSRKLQILESFSE